jgi:2-methylcitrate dehydratase PrpD
LVFQSKHNLQYQLLQLRLANLNEFFCTPYIFLRFGRWVNAAAAAVFAALLDLGSRRTRPAADAAFLLVTSLLDFLVFFH